MTKTGIFVALRHRGEYIVAFREKDWLEQTIARFSPESKAKAEALATNLNYVLDVAVDGPYSEAALRRK